MDLRAAASAWDDPRAPLQHSTLNLLVWARDVLGRLYQASPEWCQLRWGTRVISFVLSVCRLCQRRHSWAKLHVRRKWIAPKWGRPKLEHKEYRGERRTRDLDDRF
ncbi:uncharacterized protein SPSK_04704 [Sporothrix schenckii 1099-18]|uniref:Uncharacterized protein n=1 Tax=Sporothrix schenckii 1099-18 TaxID=1397361 RepID=A0A0F2M2N2_SPOSC|nr:uncharacterized protein SPSK_04704 [Sporothrix schenckii 1099-18]KJR83005.1 hypothetical protein SPSK_04704 [Sporothrix schenckii 1099-18]